MRRAPRLDANHAAIVAALRAAGATVQSLAAVGDGCPDLLVGFAGHNYLIEVKDGTKPPSARRLTPEQERWHAAWAGQAAIVSSLAGVRDLLGVLHERAEAEREEARRLVRARDADLAVSQVCACIRRHLEELPPSGHRVELDEADVLNLARHIVLCLDEYGRAT